jgi:hypothetical protein
MYAPRSVNVSYFPQRGAAVVSTQPSYSSAPSSSAGTMYTGCQAVQQQPQAAPAPQFSAMPMSAAEFGDRCGATQPAQTVRVPQYNNIVHTQNVQYETITQEVTYVDVPVLHSYEQRVYPTKSATQCPVSAAAALEAPSCGC